MTLCAAAPALHPTALESLHQRAALLERAIMSDSAPWLPPTLSQLRDLEQEGDLIPGLGDLRIQAKTASTARLLLSLVVDAGVLPTPTVSPVSGGAISVVWTLGQREVKFAIFPDERPMFFNIENDEISNEGILDLMDPKSVRKPIDWMLQVV